MELTKEKHTDLVEFIEKNSNKDVFVSKAPHALPSGQIIMKYFITTGPTNMKIIEHEDVINHCESVKSNEKKLFKVEDFVVKTI